MEMVGYQPSDVLFMFQGRWGRRSTWAGRCYRIVVQAHNMKGKSNNVHVVAAPGSTQSLAITNAGIWLANCSLQLKVPADAPMVSGISKLFDSTVVLSKLLWILRVVA